MRCIGSKPQDGGNFGVLKKVIIPNRVPEELDDLHLLKSVAIHVFGKQNSALLRFKTDV